MNQTAPSEIRKTDQEEMRFLPDKDLYFDTKFTRFPKVILPVAWVLLLFGIAFRVEALDSWLLYLIVMQFYLMNNLTQSAGNWEKYQPILTISRTAVSLSAEIPRTILWTDIDSKRTKITGRSYRFWYKSSPWKDAVQVYRCYSSGAYQLIDAGLAGRDIEFPQDPIEPRSQSHLDDTAHSVRAIGCICAVHGLLTMTTLAIVYYQTGDHEDAIMLVAILAVLAAAFAFVSIQLLRLKESGRIGFITLSNLVAAIEIRRRGLSDYVLLGAVIVIAVLSIALSQKQSKHVVDKDHYRPLPFSIALIPGWAWVLMGVLGISDLLTMLSYIVKVQP